MHGERDPQPYERGEESYMAYVIGQVPKRTIAGIDVATHRIEVPVPEWSDVND